MHEKTLIDEDKQLFQKVLDAFKKNDVEEFTNLIKYASAQRIELSTLVDDNGNTLMHHFILGASPVFIKVARNDYFDSFNPSWHITNKDGHTPFDLLANLPPEKNDFKKRAEITYGFWSQLYILSQFRQYLEFKKRDNETGYDVKECERIIKRLENGHCNGFAATWLLLWLNDNEDEYYKLLGPVVDWNRERDSLDAALTKQFEYAISVIRSFQQGRVFSDEKEMHEKQLDEWAGLKSTKDKHRDVLIGSPSFFKPQDSWEDFSEPGKYKSEYQWESPHFSLEALMILLEKLGKNSENKLGLSIGSYQHATAAGIKNSKLYFFDPNCSPVSNTTAKVELPRVYDLTSEEDRKKAAEDIYFAVAYRPAESLYSSFQGSIKTISLSETPYKGEEISMSAIGLSRAKRLGG
ncbi:hypothetical protein [Legionella sp. WA2022007384]